MFVDAARLPQSNTDGPEDWGDAWSKLGAAGDQVQAVIENTTADTAAMEAVYDRRIRKIEQLTGQTLTNPLRVASQRDRDLAASGILQGQVQLRELDQRFDLEDEEEFNTKARGLAERYPQVNAVIATSVEDEKKAVMREAEQALARAASSPALGVVGRFTAQLAGGLRGAARDPVQWGMAVVGAGPSGGATVAGRIGRTMFQEFLLNGGQEAFLQLASEERKREAGVEHGLDNALKNVGIAGTFGALFGGTVQAGGEIARVLKLGEGGAERATRILEGRPEPGDVEVMAAATGRNLSADEASDLARSFEERTLDEMMIPADPTPDDVTLMRATVRYAEDPDSFPSPELVEQALVDRAGAAGRTLSADDYERIYSGDSEAIDAYRDSLPARDPDGGVDIADTFGLDPYRDMSIRPDRITEPFDDAAVAHAEAAAGELVEPRKVGPFGPIFRPDEFEGDWMAAVRALQEREGGEIPGMLEHPEIGPIDVVWGQYDPKRPSKGAGLSKILGKHPEVVERLPEILPAMRVTDRSANRIQMRSDTHRAAVRLDYDGESKTWLITAFEEDGRRAGKTTDRPGNRQGDGHSSSPSSTGESIADAGAPDNLAELKRDTSRPRSGSPERVVDAVPVEDGAGGWLTIGEALDLADEPNFHADLLEACKL